MISAPLLRVGRRGRSFDTNLAGSLLKRENALPASTRQSRFERPPDLGRHNIRLLRGTKLNQQKKTDISSNTTARFVKYGSHHIPLIYWSQLRQEVYESGRKTQLNKTKKCRTSAEASIGL